MEWRDGSKDFNKVSGSGQESAGFYIGFGIDRSKDTVLQEEYEVEYGFTKLEWIRPTAAEISSPPIRPYLALLELKELHVKFVPMDSPSQIRALQP